MTNVSSPLLNQSRRKQNNSSPSDSNVEHRTEIERDYDRILFSTPVRRLADKTQVFPLERNDSVRNRLTHSHEVSNLARSIGTTLVYKGNFFPGENNNTRNIPALLAAVGLVHDLGNPPFGHQGEAAIQAWFKNNTEKVLPLSEVQNTDQDQKNKRLFKDFLKFEGNAQTFRLVTRLQLLNDNYGLDLTYATLAAMLKYPIGSDCINKSHVASKKHGFFESERAIAEEVLQKTGISEKCRHPVTYIMEACDDIAYVVLDIEDAVKKGLASFSDLIAYLKHHSNGDKVINSLIEISNIKHESYRKASLSPSELNDVSMQRFRVSAIHALVVAATDAFVQHRDSFMDGSQSQSLLELSSGKELRKHLGKFAKEHAFQHRSVLEVELKGYNTITQLMDLLWRAINDTDPSPNNDQDPKLQPSHPFDRYVYTRISENYKRVYNEPAPEVTKLPLWYRKCLLLTDMISGMTDTYAIDLLEEIKNYELKGIQRQ